ncbi:MAG TPA: transcription elongation factor GreA [Candidatus Methylomirabilis sp.]|nr:transcription elongation factor GreA [Candidatus Methylomirabilis sp.]
MRIEELLEKLRKEFETLEREFRQEIPKKIQAARELGDLRESGEYETIKDRQGFVQARIAFLRQRIAEISKIDLIAIPKDRVALGSTVHLVDEKSGEESAYTLVFPETMDGKRGWISFASPIGRSLISKRVGDRVILCTPGGTRVCEVTKLQTLHDSMDLPSPLRGEGADEGGT